MCLQFANWIKFFLWSEGESEYKWSGRSLAAQTEWRQRTLSYKAPGEEDMAIQLLNIEVFQIKLKKMKIKKIVTLTTQNHE